MGRQLQILGNITCVCVCVLCVVCVIVLYDKKKYSR